MEPIISPWLIYLIHLADNFVVGFTVIAVISGIILIIGGIAAYATMNENDEKEWLEIKKYGKRTMVIFITFLMLAIICPGKKTLIAMVVADNVTYNNVEKAIEAGKNVKEEIKKDMLDLIEAIQNKDEAEAEK